MDSEPKLDKIDMENRKVVDMSTLKQDDYVVCFWHDPTSGLLYCKGMTVEDCQALNGTGTLGAPCP
jgi:hypothetical protein